MAAYDIVPIDEDDYGSARASWSAGILSIDDSGDETKPTVTIISPAPGVKIIPSTLVVVDVTDNLGKLVRASVSVDIAGTDFEEVVYNGYRFGKKYRGASNTVARISGGIRLTLLRDGGWLGRPEFLAQAIDSSGNEAD